MEWLHEIFQISKISKQQQQQQRLNLQLSYECNANHAWEIIESFVKTQPWTNLNHDTDQKVKKKD